MFIVLHTIKPRLPAVYIYIVWVINNRIIVTKFVCVILASYQPKIPNIPIEIPIIEVELQHGSYAVHVTMSAGMYSYNYGTSHAW